MDANTFTPTTYQVTAVMSVPQYKGQEKQEKQQKKKMKKNFDAIFEREMESDEMDQDFNQAGCYGKDAKPVVKNVSHFYLKL